MICKDVMDITLAHENWLAKPNISQTTMASSSPPKKHDKDRTLVQTHILRFFPQKDAKKPLDAEGSDLKPDVTKSVPCTFTEVQDPCLSDVEEITSEQAGCSEVPDVSIIVDDDFSQIQRMCVVHFYPVFATRQKKILRLDHDTNNFL